MRFSSGRPAIPDAKDVEVDGTKLNLIITTLYISPHHPLIPDMLVKRKSIWTEISGLAEPRKLETPVFPVSYINPPVRLLLPHSASAVIPINPS